MSVVVAIKKNGVIYMGADTQISARDSRSRTDSETRYKVQKLPSGVLLGGTGNSTNIQRILEKPSVFNVEEKEGLTKRFIVEKIAPKIYKTIKEEGLLENKEGKQIDIGCSLILAYKEKMFHIDSSLAVYAGEKYILIGSGGIASEAYLIGLDLDGDIHSQMRIAMQANEELINSVSGPFVFIDTERLEYTVEE